MYLHFSLRNEDAFDNHSITLGVAPSIHRFSKCTTNDIHCLQRSASIDSNDESRREVSSCDIALAKKRDHVWSLSRLTDLRKEIAVSTGKPLLRVSKSQVSHTAVSGPSDIDISKCQYVSMGDYLSQRLVCHIF